MGLHTVVVTTKIDHIIWKLSQQRQVTLSGSYYYQDRSHTILKMSQHRSHHLEVITIMPGHTNMKLSQQRQATPSGSYHCKARSHQYEAITTQTGHTPSCCDVAGKLRLRSARKPDRRTWSERPTGGQQQNGNNRCNSLSLQCSCAACAQTAI